ncbi:hypothetical protein P171DRAFT_490977 [Karstenula rhodostoma CBS 690.94]|uniref:Uncharacterized protein n=1 Tax=Karstenula rhodostoma CBS 690.94 TaxID=1392251 RepID=A0A9P4U6N0_9PLEO|nr:hypothetical protein P171DRAFT_490977 [Karstenula rhodostoma CBS 690.94]
MRFKLQDFVRMREDKSGLRLLLGLPSAGPHHCSSLMLNAHACSETQNPHSTDRALLLHRHSFFSPDNEMWSETVDPNGRFMQPNGFPLTVLTISFVFLALSLLTVGLRLYIRLSKRMFGIDDAFLAAGGVLYMVVIGLSSYGHFVGLGRKEVNLNQWQWMNAMKYYIIWILVYVVEL